MNEELQYLLRSPRDLHARHITTISLEFLHSSKAPIS